MRVRRPGLVRLVGCVVLLAACSCDKPVAPPTNSAKPCGSATVQLAVLQAATVACTAGTTVTLQGGGASYLVVPNFATGNAVNRATSYTIGIANGASANVVPVAGPSLDVAPSVHAPMPAVIQRRARQHAFDAALMEEARQKVASGAWRVQARRLTAPNAPASRAVVPPVGSIQRFHVLSSESPAQFTAVGARLSYVGANILLYVDTLAPANGFTSDQLNAFGQLFDQTLYPIDLNAFGSPTDIDQNGHLIMLLSPVVNALTPASSCATQGFIGGFFEGFDLASSDTSSNRGEIFYSLVPDPTGTVSCAHTVADLLDETPSTFLHELQHLINFSQHVVVHGGAPEFGWLDEGMSIVAEEMGSLYYENKFPPPSGRTNPAQLFPDSSQGFINGLLFDSYSYLLKTDTATVTLHSDADGGLAWRGGDWLLMRWLGDVKGVGIYKTLVESNLTGTANIASAAGESFDALFGDFSLALYTDSIPGTPKSSIPARNRFVVRNLRRMYQRLFDTSQGSSFVPRPFPIITVPLTSSISASLVPGTMSFYRLNTSAGQTTVTIDFGSTPGVPLTDALHPQLSIFRIPPGP
ncbi:MAG TPA: hypothetical protein VJO33_04435 [Gemmatimonadaceae bacterium]|nr:hypothetical protein [Gemmatimonadaceae bacterium]